jgi:hypothetical protein
MHREERRWIPALGVLGVLVFVVLGGYVVAAALSEPVGPPVAVGGVVAVQPLSGWGVADTAPLAGLPFARLTRGSGNLDLVVVPGYGGDATGLAKEYVDRVLSRQLSRLSVSSDLHPVTLQNGLLGQRLAYVGVSDNGSSIEGEVTAFVSAGGDGVVFDGWAPEGLLTYVDGDLHTMAERAVFA